MNYCYLSLFCCQQVRFGAIPACDFFCLLNPSTTTDPEAHRIAWWLRLLLLWYPNIWADTIEGARLRGLQEQQWEDVRGRAPKMKGTDETIYENDVQVPKKKVEEQCCNSRSRNSRSILPSWFPTCLERNIWGQNRGICTKKLIKGTLRLTDFYPAA